MSQVRYGGQAVIEGVMMRGPSKVAVAVRMPDGSVHLKVEDHVPLAARFRLAGLPVVRGAVALYESLVLGVRALLYSAEVTSMGEMTKGEGMLAVVLAFLVALALFMVLPTLLVSLLMRFLGTRSLAMNLLEGAVRLAVLLVYVYAISRMKDIQRVLEYHGAEHKAVHVQEAGLALTLENARDFSTMHPRCGTSFLLFTVIVSVLVFSLFGWPNLVMRVAMRLALLPLIAGVSYEGIRLAGNSNNPLVKLLSWPGMLLQKLTTREPDDLQLMVALQALEAVKVPDQGSNQAGGSKCKSC
ncbi:MAG: DUF1385 domain-containing protein [Bacillota bacterium]